MSEPSTRCEVCGAFTKKPQLIEGTGLNPNFHACPDCVKGTNLKHRIHDFTNRKVRWPDAKMHFVPKNRS